MTGPFFQPLRAGDRVAVIAPSGAVTSARLEAGAAEITRAGCTPFIHPQCYQQQGRFAGTPAERLAAFHDVFADETVKAILCARGGYGVQQFVDRIDWEKIRRTPKPFVGYSDLTALINPLAARCGFPAFHGPMLGDLTLEANAAENWPHLWRVLKGEEVDPTDHPAACDSRVLVEGMATGRLGGGNLSLLAADCGTASQLSPPEILLLEDVTEDLYRFDRKLLQLQRVGLFSALKGVIIGTLVEVNDKGPPPFGTDAEGILQNYFGGLGIPVVLDFPAGHGRFRTLLPLGIPVTLDARCTGVRLTHAPLFLPG